jgi:hypothetical protein
MAPAASLLRLALWGVVNLPSTSASGRESPGRCLPLMTVDSNFIY